MCCLAQDVLPPLAFLHGPETGECEVDVLHYTIFAGFQLMLKNPNHFWLSIMDAETEPHATLIKAINAAGLESVDSLVGLYNFNEPLEMQVT